MDRKLLADLIVLKIEENLNNLIMKLKDDFSNIEQFDSIIKSKGFFNLWERFQSDGYDGLDYQELANWQYKFKPLEADINLLLSYPL